MTVCGKITKNISSKEIIVPTSFERLGGFTLVELLVVISIISLLASTVLASVGSMRDKADNAYKVRMMGEYQKAFELFRDDFGAYPWDASISVVSRTTCLASTPCEPGPLYPSNVINNVLAPYITMQPAFKPHIVDFPPFGPSWSKSGPQYNCTVLNGNPNLCTEARISYVLKEGMPCASGATGGTINGFTYCTARFQ